MRPREEVTLTAAASLRDCTCLTSRHLITTGYLLEFLRVFNIYASFIFLKFHFYLYCRHHPPLSYEEVFQKSSPTNCTVYCGGLSNTDDENAIRRAFSSFGRIVDVRFFRDKG